MDAITLLTDEHAKMRKLLTELEATTERGVKTRQELFATIKGELTLHEVIEEEIFYPELKAHPKAEDIVLEGYQEHHVVDLLMGELEEPGRQRRDLGRQGQGHEGERRASHGGRGGRHVQAGPPRLRPCRARGPGPSDGGAAVSAAASSGSRSPRAGRARRARDESLRAGRHTARSPRTPWSCEDGPAMRTIDWVDGEIHLIDQTRLPDELVVLRISELDQLIDAIARLAVRGAPALGVAGGFGVALLAAAPPGRRGCRASRRAAPARCPPDGGQPRLGRRPRAALPAGRARRRAFRGRADPRRGHRGLRGHGDPRRRPDRRARRAAGGARDDDLQHRRAGGRGAWDGAGRDRRAPCPRQPRGGAAARDPAAAPGCPAHGLGAGPRWGRRSGCWSTPRRHPCSCAAARTSCSSARTGSPATGTPPTRSAACRWRSRRVMPACRSWWSRRRRRSTRRPRRATGSRSRNAATAEVTSYRGVRSAPAGTRALNPAFDVTPAGLITAIVTDRRVVRLDRGETPG